MKKIDEVYRRGDPKVEGDPPGPRTRDHSGRDEDRNVGIPPRVKDGTIREMTE